MKRLKIGVIGTGLMGSLHAQNLAFRTEGAELEALCDIDAEAVAACARRCQLDVIYRGYEELLSHLGLEAVAVCTPPDTHAAVIEAAADAGKQIFCEKPVGCDLSTIDRALAAVAKAGVKLQVGFNRRFDRRFRQAQEAVAAGKIGEPLTLHIISRDPVRTAGEKGTFAPEMFLDTTIHDFDMARFVMGSEIVGVSVLASPPQGGRETPLTALTTVGFANGGAGTIDNSWLSTYGYDQRLEVFGTQGMVSVGNEGQSAAADDSAPFFVRRYFDSYIEEMNAFVECVVDGREPAATGADGRAAVALALAARRSWREGRAVSVSEGG